MRQTIKTPNLKNIKITDPFIGYYVDMVSEKLVGYQWDILNDRIEGVEKSYVVENFLRAAGLSKGPHQGAIFCDTDAYKWLETVAYCIASGKAKEYEHIADEFISLIGKAQEDDGYLNTYFILSHPDEKWKNLTEGHELYGAGHLIEAAVAYYEATGKRELLDISIKYANLIYDVFTKKNLHGCPGHQEIELSLVKLARITSDSKYLELAKHFLEVRGDKPNYLINNLRTTRRIFPEFADYDDKYAQSHMKPIYQTTAEGHAVRAMYMYSAMADIAGEFQDINYKKACENLWENITEKRMYITGGIGSSGYLERFTTDYDLPNDRAYCESCASVGLMMFGQRMANISGNAKYYDVVERAFLNTVLSGISIDGEKYFYVNPLEVWPDNCLESTSMKHVKNIRQPWFACACCPPNIARTLASIGQYIYGVDDKAVYINQFIDSIFEVEAKRGKASIEIKSLSVNMKKILLNIDHLGNQPMIIKIRVPDYYQPSYFKINNEEIQPAIENRYAIITISQNGQHEIVMSGNVNPKFISANDNIKFDVAKLALSYGPYIYCIEEVDNGKKLSNLFVKADTEITKGELDKKLPGGLPSLIFEGKKLTNKIDKLYDEPGFSLESKIIKAIPYCLWCNREQGEMQVWLNAILD